MTDAEVTHRVEQAMLGAMMARPRSAAWLGVTAGHFADARHQAIAAALTGTAGTERGLFGRLRALFTRRGRAAREAAAYMESLPGLCPEPAHIGAYFRMLAADRDQRAAAAQASVQAEGNQVLSVASERLGQMRGRTDASTGLPRGVARLARALAARTGRPDQQAPAPAQQRGQAPAPVQAAAQGQVPGQFQAAPVPRGQVPPQGQAVQGQPGQARGAVAAREPARGTAAAQAATDAGRAFEPGRFARPEDLQDAVLAALMHHPDEAREVLGWLPPDAFTGPRRELYTLIGRYARDRMDIDPVTLAWGAAQVSGARPADAPRTEHDGWLRPDYVLRAGALDTAPGAASVLGRMLLADQVCTANLGPDWHRAPRATATPAPRPAPDQQAQTQSRAQRQAQSQTEQRQPAQQQSGPANAPAQQNGNAPQGQRAAGNSSGQGPARATQNGPYRQARPSGGNRPPARAGAGTAPAQSGPGGLIQQPPPVPGQTGPTPSSR